MRVNKKSYYLLLALNILLSISLILAFVKLKEVEPLYNIKGTYQSTEYLPDLYNMSFNGDRFFLEYNR